VDDLPTRLRLPDLHTDLLLRDYVPRVTVTPAYRTPHLPLRYRTRCLLPHLHTTTHFVPHTLPNHTHVYTQVTYPHLWTLILPVISGLGSSGAICTHYTHYHYRFYTHPRPYRRISRDGYGYTGPRVTAPDLRTVRLPRTATPRRPTVPTTPAVPVTVDHTRTTRGWAGRTPHTPHTTDCHTTGWNTVTPLHGPPRTWLCPTLPTTHTHLHTLDTLPAPHTHCHYRRTPATHTTHLHTTRLHTHTHTTTTPHQEHTGWLGSCPVYFLGPHNSPPATHTTTPTHTHTHHLATHTGLHTPPSPSHTFTAWDTPTCLHLPTDHTCVYTTQFPLPTYRTTGTIPTDDGPLPIYRVYG